MSVKLFISKYELTQKLLSWLYLFCWYSGNTEVLRFQCIIISILDMYVAHYRRFRYAVWLCTQQDPQFACQFLPLSRTWLHRLASFLADLLCLSSWFTITSKGKQHCYLFVCSWKFSVAITYNCNDRNTTSGKKLRRNFVSCSCFCFNDCSRSACRTCNKNKFCIKIVLIPWFAKQLWPVNWQFCQFANYLLLEFCLALDRHIKHSTSLSSHIVYGGLLLKNKAV